MDHSTSLLRLIFLSLGAALVLLAVRSAFRLPPSFTNTSSSTTPPRVPPAAAPGSRLGDAMPDQAQAKADVPLP
ncbi:hypothetical protein HU200_038389 [Digitaria exilis]|uniref:Uncharacterized protein n=1 Tax=Digitaria exilis TaxID=1010633 RepID=A0A835BDV4_9POAL|nr:hypothetical protein HU200_038389 [Digitaria exilis]